MSRPLLVMLLGVPGSGKTFFSQQLAERLHGIRLNSDAMRLSIFGSLDEISKTYHSEHRERVNTYTFGAMDYVTKQLLAADIDVIYDAIHTKRVDREKQEAIADQCNAIPILLRVTVPREVALRRITERPVSEDARQFSTEQAEEVIAHFEDTTETPLTNEHVLDINGELSFDEQYNVFEREIERIRANYKPAN